ncbi:MAG: SDR family oxidoreductase [Rhizobiaceae bacterium]|nr:SDR family oxidoreductase [Rhizobiaceae bacterium]
MDLGISGRKAIVCASSEGLGKGCALALAQAGCEVIVNARTQATVDATVAEIAAATGANVTGVAADVGAHEGQKALLSACPTPDILVNNNGGPPRRSYAELTRDDMINGVVQNMITPIELIQSVAEGMAERNFGRIVNITSLSVLMPIEGLDLSSGARAGLTAFLAGVRPIYASRNVTMNNLLPGKMDTKRLRGGLEAGAKASGKSFDEVAQAQKDEIPAKRFGTAEEFGNTCAFLCSGYAGYITGQNILMDGGLFPHSF